MRNEQQKKLTYIEDSSAQEQVVSHQLTPSSGQPGQVGQGGPGGGA